ncbi:coiled-coil-helix-coiled-coil-helix domain containing 3a isoform X2 [Dunckerocampus dactyliophorus]|uniref:coiled-coil-helix-coiled-coil-helix domain containing 3a isoform X2 n=1 Tax=Dunckerocampus dactyliophorus TaxID=161453 RepID=UPI0024063BA9|nr:coiled-coil-helix-coiled-coil-helix domain containing 3a isoform X2 [Dunckerocampus dactyliophorus]
MGANNSTRRVSYESDENENVTVVKGIRLSENVINRMREPTVAPPFVPSPRPAPSLSLVPPPPPPETVPSPTHPSQPEQVEAPTIIDMVLPSSSPAAFEPLPPLSTPATPPPPTVAAVEPVTTSTCFTSPAPADATIPAVVNAITPLAPPLIEPTAPSPVASSPALLLPDSQLLSSLPVSEPVTTLPAPPQAQAPAGSESSSPVPESSPVPPPPPPAAPAIDEEALKKKISDELYEGLEKQRVKTEQELQAWLEAEKARAAAQAQAETKRHVEDEVSRILSAERTVAQESIQQAVLRERIATEDEKLRAQLYAKQLEAKEADLNKQEAFYREQVARLEERSAQFYKVTTENYHTAADQVNAKFKRYEAYPVCADLQGQILACYQENAGKTLHCSNIAALYLQCVNNAKQKNKHAASRTDDTPS